MPVGTQPNIACPVLQYNTYIPALLMVIVDDVLKAVMIVRNTLFCMAHPDSLGIVLVQASYLVGSDGRPYLLVFLQTGQGFVGPVIDKQAIMICTNPDI